MAGQGRPLALAVVLFGAGAKDEARRARRATTKTAAASRLGMRAEKPLSTRLWQAPKGYRAGPLPGRYRRDERDRRRAVPPGLDRVDSFAPLDRRLPLVTAAMIPARTPALAIPCGQPVCPQNGQFEAPTMNPKNTAHPKRNRIHRALAVLPSRQGGAFLVLASGATVIGEY